MPKMTYWGVVETAHGRLEEREFSGVWMVRQEKPLSLSQARRSLKVSFTGEERGCTWVCGS